MSLSTPEAVTSAPAPGPVNSRGAFFVTISIDTNLIVTPTQSTKGRIKVDLFESDPDSCWCDACKISKGLVLFCCLFEFVGQQSIL